MNDDAGGTGSDVPWVDDPSDEDVPREGDESWEDPDGRPADTVDPGNPSAENVAFVVLGALLTLFVLARVAGFV